MPTLSLIPLVAATSGQTLRDVPSVSFWLILKQRTQRLTELTFMASSPHTSQVLVNLYETGAFHSKKFSYHSPPSERIYNICHFVLLLCWMRVTVWRADCPGASGQCCRPVSKAGNSTLFFILKNGRHCFHTNLCKTTFETKTQKNMYYFVLILSGCCSSTLDMTTPPLFNHQNFICDNSVYLM
jgi:hypothetical protein